MDTTSRLYTDMDKYIGSIEPVNKPYTKAELAEIAEYQRGVDDCINNVIHKSKSPDYDRGYSEQYAFEQTQNSRVIS